jgi:hypothetical protein
LRFGENFFKRFFLILAKVGTLSAKLFAQVIEYQALTPGGPARQHKCFIVNDLRYRGL